MITGSRETGRENQEGNQNLYLQAGEPTLQDSVCCGCKFSNYFWFLQILCLFPRNWTYKEQYYTFIFEGILKFVDLWNFKRNVKYPSFSNLIFCKSKLIIRRSSNVKTGRCLLWYHKIRNILSFWLWTVLESIILTLLRHI